MDQVPYMLGWPSYIRPLFLLALPDAGCTVLYCTVCVAETTVVTTFSFGEGGVRSSHEAVRLSVS